MNRRVVIFCSIIAVVLAIVAGVVIVDLFSEPETVQVKDSRIDAMSAVPLDAIAVANFEKLEDINSLLKDPKFNFSQLVDQRSEIVKFISLLPDQLINSEAILSLHYSTKNRVSLLFALSIPKNCDKEELSDQIYAAVSSVTKKRYGSTIINKCVVPKINYSIQGNFLVASTAIVVVESSIRHIENSISIIESDAFLKQMPYINSNISILVNHDNLGKFFSGTVNRDYLSNAPVAASFSSWAGLGFTFDNNKIVAEGTTYFPSDPNNVSFSLQYFSSIFQYQDDKKSTFLSILPENTADILSVRVSSPEKLLDAYVTYLQAHKKYNDYNYLNILKTKEYKISPRDWFLNLGVEEFAITSIPVNGKIESAILLKVKKMDKNEMNVEGEIRAFKYKGYISTLLGGIFSKVEDDYQCSVDDYYVIGSKSIVSSFARINNVEDYFSLKDYLEQTNASNIVSRSSTISYYMNPIFCVDSLTNVFKPFFINPVINGINKFNYSSFYVDYSIKNNYKNNLFSQFNIENMEKLPEPKKSLIDLYNERKSNKLDSVIVSIPKGPFEIVNFINKKKNYIEQLPNNRIRLLNEKNKSVWTVEFDKPFCGYVQQMDLYKNKKLQIIFGAGSKIYMLDRLGRWVKDGFPLELGKDILLGPKVYDIKGDKNYMFMVLHKDNTLSLYGVDGNYVPGWSQISLNEPIVKMPELLKVGENFYIDVRTSQQTLIYNLNGLIVADFTKKKKLKPDTDIKIVSENELKAISIDGTELIINIETGNIKKM